MPYIRLTLDAPSNEALKQWVAQFQSFGLISQLDPKAGLGCHPFHITVIGGLHNHSVADINKSLDAIATGIHPFTLGPSRLSKHCNKLEFGNIPEHVTAVRLGSAFVNGRPYGFPRPVHITIGNSTASSPQLHIEMARKISELPSLRVVGVEFEDDNGGRTIPPMARPLSSGSSATSAKVVAEANQKASSDSWRVCNRCGAKVIGRFKVHFETCLATTGGVEKMVLGGGHEDVELYDFNSRIRGHYFLCIRLPETFDKALHNFIDTNCSANELLDNKGTKTGSVRMNLHITFTLRIPCDLAAHEAPAFEENIKKILQSEAPSKPIRIYFDDMYCSRVSRIKSGIVHCIGIAAQSPDLAAYREAVASRIPGANKGYEGAGHMSMAYFDDKYSKKYSDIVSENSSLLKGQHFSLTEIEMKRPDQTSEIIQLFR